MTTTTSSVLATRMREASDKVAACLEDASKKFNIPALPHITTLRFDLKGKAAGTASTRGSLFGYGISENTEFHIRLNHVMMLDDTGGWKHIINETIPHEVAHLVCFAKPSLGRNHDKGWKNVCIRLGGTGETRHTERVFFEKGDTYEYTSEIGRKVMVSSKLHRQIQSGVARTWRIGGRVTKACAYELVARSGIPVNHTQTPKQNTPKKTNVPSIPATQSSSTKKPTKAGTIRGWISDANASGTLNREELIARAIMELSMPKSQATSYVRDLIEEAKNKNPS